MLAICKLLTLQGQLGGAREGNSDFVVHEHLPRIQIVHQSALCLFL